LAGAILVMAPASSWAVHNNGAAHANKAEDVRTTIHNLGLSNPIAGTNIAAGTGTPTTEVCVFCHTPHGADKNNAGSAPLWNRHMPDSTGYTMYSAPNFDGVSAAASPVGVSLACLSCHDGSIAVDALINGPGSGRFFSTNLGSSAGPGTTLNLVQNGGGGFLGADHSMEEGTRTDTGSNYSQITGAAEPFPNLTRDLSDDHPISFQMPTTDVDPQFDATRVPDGQITKLERAATYLDKRDAIRLYPPNGGTTMGAAEGWVECASCHNPHAPRPLVLRLPSSPSGTMDSTTIIPLSWGGDGTKEWGSDPNSGSAICLTCHNK